MKLKDFMQMCIQENGNTKLAGQVYRYMAGSPMGEGEINLRGQMGLRISDAIIRDDGEVALICRQPPIIAG